MVGLRSADAFPVVPTPWTRVHLDTTTTSLCYCWGIHTPAFLIHMAYATMTTLLISRTSPEKVAYKLLSALKTTLLSQYTTKPKSNQKTFSCGHLLDNNNATHSPGLYSASLPVTSSPMTSILFRPVLLPLPTKAVYRVSTCARVLGI